MDLAVAENHSGSAANVAGSAGGAFEIGPDQRSAGARAAGVLFPGWMDDRPLGGKPNAHPPASD